MSELFQMNINEVRSLALKLNQCAESFKDINIRGTYSNLNLYSMNDIRNAIDNLNRISQNLYSETDRLVIQAGCLVKVFEAVQESEEKAVKILNNIVVISHEDMGKIVSELRYYSQVTPNSESVYISYFLNRYKKGGDVSLSREEYKELRTIYSLLKNARNGYYSYAASFTSSDLVEATVKGSWINGDGISTKLKTDSDNFSDSDSLKYSANASADYKTSYYKIEWASSYDLGDGWTGTKIESITLGVFDVNTKIDFSVGLSTDFFKKIKDYVEAGGDLNDAIKEGLGGGISVGGSVSGLIYESTVSGVKDGNGVYTKTTATVGSMYAEAELSTSGVSCKAGVSVLDYEIVDGLIIHGNKIGAKGSVNLGFETSVEFGKDGAEVNAGMFGLGLELDFNDSNPYIWLSDEELYGEYSGSFGGGIGGGFR